MISLAIRDQLPKFKGHTTIFSMRDGKVVRMVYKNNQIMNGASMATAKLWGGYSNFKPAAMYFEFQNLADPGDTPVYPTFEADAGVEYYIGLQYAPDRDFIRVPVLIGPGVADVGAGALLTHYAIAPDTDLGFWGKNFTGTANSVVIGGALVATPTENQSDDIIMCRNYPAGTKIPKTTGEQIGMVWNVEFPFTKIES